MFKALGRLFHEKGQREHPLAREAKRLVRERGWTIVPVEGPLSWAYSIGFPETVGAPELICFAPALGAARLLADAREHLSDGRLSLRDGAIWDALGFPLCCRPVHKSQVMGFQWMRLAKEHAEAQAGRRVDVEAYQLFFPDKEGRYPWEEGCLPGVKNAQPLLFNPLDLPGQPS